MLQKNSPFVFHSFGDNENPDVKIAKQISRAVGVPLDQYDDELPSVDETLSQVRRYLAQTSLIAPASSVLKLHHYDAMDRNGRVLIDGGFGEISRRQMGNRLLSRGVSVLCQGDPTQLVELMATSRADIFQRDTMELMMNSALREIESAWRKMPQIEEIGAENFVDLFSLRTRVANNSPGPQDWIDSQILNYMPYVQPSFLREVFHVALRERRNAKLYRKTIRAHSPTLTSFPLAKDGVTYPFSFGTIPSWFWRVGKKLTGRRYGEPYAYHLLAQLKEFVMDTAHSTATREFAPYDSRKILTLLHSYYGGRSELASSVDWWLTFEIWRQSLR
jgi:hypothetical protein